MIYDAKARPQREAAKAADRWPGDRSICCSCRTQLSSKSLRGQLTTICNTSSREPEVSPKHSCIGNVVPSGAVTRALAWSLGEVSMSSQLTRLEDTGPGGVGVL